MIVVCEMNVRGFTHEEFNAGLLNQLSLASGDEVLYMAESAQVSFVKKIIEARLDNNMIQFKGFDINSDEDIVENMLNSLNCILCGDKTIKKVIFSSHGVSCSKKIIDTVLMFKSIDFYFCEHGEIELLLDPIYYHVDKPYRGRKEIDSDMFERSVEFWNDKERFDEHIRKLANLENVRFIVYNKSFFSHEATSFMKNNTIVINLPMIYDDKQVVKRELDIPVRIGITPKTMAKDYYMCYELLKSVNRSSWRYRGKFEFVFRDWDIGRRVKNTRLYQTADSSREEVMKFYDDIDYMLLLYDHNRYIISASGVFFDAVSAAIPVLTLDSPSITQYSNDEIYVGASSVNDLSKEVCDIIRNFNKDSYLMLRNRIIRKREEYNAYNIELFRKELSRG